MSVSSSVCLRSFKNIVFVTNLSSFRFLAVLLLAVVGFSVSTFAQQATIVGTVTDPSGAVVPNVNVTITNTDTGSSHAIPTNDAGQYVAPDLQVGHYTVKAEASGFKVAERKDIVVTVGDRIRVDFQMQIGAAAETVTVEAAAVHVQTDSGEVSNLISGEEVAQLSTNGRTIYSLTLLTPGASSNMPDFQVATPVGGSGAVSFNGMRYAHNIYLLDGGEDDDRGGSGGFSVMPSVDAIGEFRALTSNYSADYGLSSAGTLTMVLKSGTNQIHASAWEFNRNDAFDARNFFQPAPDKVAELRLNVFGFNVGGPVTFGHLYNPDKKKTFFFYNMEWRRLIQGQVLNKTVPDTNTYGGNFSSLLTASKPTILYVPTLAEVAPSVLARTCNGPGPGGLPAGIVQGQPFPNNTIPTCMISPNATALLNDHVYPAPNSGTNTFIGGNNSPTNVKEEIARIDHNFTDKFSVFGHWISEQISQGFGTSQWSGDDLPTVGDTFGNPSYSAVIHTTYTISPTLVNEVAFNYNGNRINIVPFAGSGLTSLAAPSGFTFSRLFPGPNNLSRIPNIDLSGISNFEISSWPWHNKADDYQIRDDISWTKGAHQFKIGGSWALYKKIQDLFGTTQGAFSFSGGFTNAAAGVNPACGTATLNCGSSFADFLLGTASSYGELGVQDSGHWNNVSTALWFQDNWRVNRRLTLNLGLRWDGVPHTYEANNRMGNFYPQLYSQSLRAKFDSGNNICSGPADPGCSAVSPGLGSSPNSILAGFPLYLNGIGISGKCYTTPTNFCVPNGLVNNHWSAFGPRLGFAYDVTGTGRTVVRGGFGVMYERVQGNDMYDAGSNPPFTANAGLNNVLFDNVSTSLASGAAGAVPIAPVGITGLAVNGYQLPVSYQYSVGVQHSLGEKTVLSVQYVGNQNRHQSDRREIDLPNQADLPALIAGTQNYNSDSTLAYPGFSGIRLSTNEVNAHYNALQVSLNGQVTKDLQLQADYTLSRSIDPTTGGDNGDLANVTNPYLGWRYDIGPSQFDRTHIFLTSFEYDIPVFRTSQNRLLKSVVGGWALTGIVTIESGLPLNLSLSGNQSGNKLPNTSNRPDLTGTISYQQTVLPGDQKIQYFNPASFANPAVGAWGNLSFDALRLPGRDNWNLSLFKTFLLSESRGSRLELRFESFNTWNHTQFQNVGGQLGSGQFGQLTSAFDPRIFQLGGKIFF
jgi:hypothetical protein